MALPEIKNDFLDRLEEQAIAQGLEKGMAKRQAADLLKVLDARSLTLSAKQRQQVRSCTGLAQLELWFDRALTAATVEDVVKD